MGDITNWEYYVGFCWYRVTKAKVIGANEGYWAIQLDDQEYGLSDGLNEFGNQGWELVAVHATQVPAGGESRYWERPNYFYIFKRPAS